MSKSSSPSPRTRFAELIRLYYLGRITNWDFEDEVLSLGGTDEEMNLIICVFDGGPWFSYDDFRECTFTATHSLTHKGKKTVARWILFLKSGQPYSWPSPRPRPFPSWISYPLLFCGLPLAYIFGNGYLLPAGPFLVIIATILNLKLQPNLPPTPSLDSEYWPFLDQSHFEQALCHPPYLHGPAPALS